MTQYFEDDINPAKPIFQVGIATTQTLLNRRNYLREELGHIEKELRKRPLIEEDSSYERSVVGRNWIPTLLEEGEEALEANC